MSSINNRSSSVQGAKGTVPVIDDGHLKSETMHLLRFASLLETHRYYGAVHATSKECLDLQQSELPKVFEHIADDSVCCQIPCFTLPAASSMPPNANPDSSVVTKLSSPSVWFPKTELPNLPLSLLEESTSVFTEAIGVRLAKTKKMMLDRSFKTILQRVPSFPSAVATQIKCLPYRQQRRDSTQVDFVHETQAQKVVIPTVLTIIMDWKLPNDKTITTRVHAPGAIAGTFVTTTTTGDRTKPILHYVSIELDKAAFEKSIAAPVEHLLRDCLVCVHGMAQISKQRLLHQATNEKADDREEEELSLINERGLTPLQQLFQSADSKLGKRKHNEAASEETARIMPHVDCSRLSLSKPKHDPNLKRQKTSILPGDMRNAEFDVPIARRRTASTFLIGGS